MRRGSGAPAVLAMATLLACTSSPGPATIVGHFRADSSAAARRALMAGVNVGMAGGAKGSTAVGGLEFMIRFRHADAQRIEAVVNLLRFDLSGTVQDVRSEGGSR